MWNDPIVEETRKLRDLYASKFNYDLDSIYQDLKNIHYPRKLNLVAKKSSNRLLVKSKISEDVSKA